MLFRSGVLRRSASDVISCCHWATETVVERHELGAEIKTMKVTLLGLKKMEASLTCGTLQ